MKAIGFYVTCDDITNYVIDKEQVPHLLCTKKMRPIIAAAIDYCAIHGSTTFTDVNLSVEVLTAERATLAPRYVILRGLKDYNVFYSFWDAENGYDVCKLATGEVVYELLSFADTTAEAQHAIYGTNVKVKFPHRVSVANLTVNPAE